MASRGLISRVDRFAGLSDRSVPVNLTRVESPDLLNIDFSDRTIARRRGFLRQTTEQLRDCSLKLDGYNDFARIKHITAYDTATAREALNFHVKLNQMPAAEVGIISRGFGTTTDCHMRITYDPSINTNLGGWRCRVYDTGGATLRNVTVNDGDAQKSHVGKIRHVVFDWSGSSTTFDFTVYDEDGSQIGTTTATVAGFVSDSLDYIVGCISTDGTTIPADGDATYAAISIAEVRMEFVTGTSAAMNAFGRELRVNAFENEVTASPALAGYWKFSDGTGAILDDQTANDNDASVGSVGATWSNDQALILGPSGLEFHGERGHVHVDATTLKSTFSSGNSWAITFLCVPKLAQGETTVRDQTLVWTGSGSTDPEPLGIQVVSDQLVAKYRDTTSLKTVTVTAGIDQTLAGVTAALSTYAGKKIRVVVERVSTTLFANFYVDNGSGNWVIAGNSVTVVAAPNATSNDMAIGRHVNSYVEPLSFHSKAGFCLLDDFAMYEDGSGGTATITNSMLSVSSTTPGLVNTEFYKITSLPTASMTQTFGMGLNDGSGNNPVTVGQLSTTATILPLPKTPFSWDMGLVTPDHGSTPEITLLRDFRRIDAKGVFRNSMLVISGTTLYEFDPSDGSLEIKTGSLPKGGKWSHAQYADKVFLACDNGQRPVVYNGSEVVQVGIDAPSTKHAVTTSGSGGTFVAGTYQSYVTFYNPSTGVESNPGPTVPFTVTGSTSSITQIALPISPDPQVTARRIWITAAGGPDGSTAYLSATVNDNSTATYTTAITALGVTPTLEYLLNEPAPQGAYVRVFKDRLWVGGNSMFPTRDFYSLPGTLTSFFSTTNFLDVDQDAGDPIVGMKALRDQLIVYLRDGRVSITPTGNSVEPFILSRVNQDVGAVSEHSILVYENRHLFLGERDVWIWSGEDAENISSPLGVDRPSVKNYIRTTISDAYKSNASIALDRSRDQMWLSVTTGSATRNNEVLVLDISQGVWSRYEMDMDILAEIEDENDEPTLYGGSWGHIVKLNTGKFDGFGSGLISTSAQGTAHLDTVVSLNVDALKGLYLHIWDSDEGKPYRRIIARNTANDIYLQEAIPFSPVDGEEYIIGTIPWKAEFVADFGNPMNLKRLRWAKIAGFRDETDGTSPNLRVLIEPNINARTWPFPGSATRAAEAFATTDNLKDFNFGGLGRLFRVMISESFSASAANDIGDVMPGLGDRIHITEFQIEADEVSAR